MASQFPKVKVVSVLMEEREEDDDMILEIKVIMVADKDDFDPDRIPDFLTRITPKIMAAKDPFPVFSFISKTDWGNRKTAAA